MDDRLENVIATLKNEFQNEPYEWYEKAAHGVLREIERTGDTDANVINRLYR